MKTIKVIDLLNKIANDEEVPEKIEYEGIEFGLDKNYKRYVHDNGDTLGEFVALDIYLNDEVEIIEEEKEIEHINIKYWSNDEYTPEERINVCMTIINELIDAVNEIRKEK